MYQKCAPEEILGSENKGSETARSSTTAYGPLLEEEWGRFRLDFDTICPLYNRVMYLHVVKHPDGGHYLLWWSPSGTWNDNHQLIFNFFVFFRFMYLESGGKLDQSQSVLRTKSESGGIQSLYGLDSVLYWSNPTLARPHSERETSMNNQGFRATAWPCLKRMKSHYDLILFVKIIFSKYILDV